MPRSYNADPRVLFVDANGQRFGYLEEGEGPLVLLIHGFPDTAHSWDAVRPALAAAGYRAVSPFTRGYAPTSIPDRDPDSRTLGHDVLALIEALGEERAVVVGHDWGADAAYAAANLGPSKISKLVTVAIPYPAGIKPTLHLAWMLRHFIGLRLPGALGRFMANDFESVDDLVRRWSPSWQFTAEDLDAVKNAFAAPGSANAALGYYRGAKLPPPRDLARKIAIPTLSVAGADDPGVSPEDYESVRRKFTGDYRVATIPGGHFCHNESPDAFNAVLLEFLGSPLGKPGAPDV
jgi:pimeloyl-ACP methyl ester carboxylesterase